MARERSAPMIDAREALLGYSEKQNKTRHAFFVFVYGAALVARENRDALRAPAPTCVVPAEPVSCAIDGRLARSFIITNAHRHVVTVSK